jgi:hypothetical protein
VSPSVLTLALPASFKFASLHIASHVVAAAIFLGQALATGACLEFFIVMLFVQQSHDIIIGNLNIAALAFVHYQLAFEADHGFAFIALNFGGLRTWCADPFLTFLFRTYYHQRVFLIIDVIFESFVALDNFRIITEENFELAGIRGYPTPRFRAFEIVNFLLIYINFEGLLNASCAVNVSTVLEGVAILTQIIKAYLALRLFHSTFSE